LPPRYVTGENGIGVMMHELVFNELVVDSQYMLKLQSDKITKNTGKSHEEYLYCFCYSRGCNMWVLILCLNERNHVLIYLCRSFRNLLPIMQKCSTKLCCSAMLLVGHWTCDS